MLHLTVEPDRILVGERFSVTFQRTLRIPDDGRNYPLPPGLGRFPLHRARDYHERVPDEWRQRDDVFLPIRQREALWLSFGAANWKPSAVKVGVGRINALTGDIWDERLRGAPQDYLVCPDQQWLDGINVGDGVIRQFVAMPLGSGYTVEGHVTGEERFGGVQICVYDPKPGPFTDQPPVEELSATVAESVPPKRAVGNLGIGAGGRIRQKVYTDPYGIDTWDQENYGAVFLHLITTEQYRMLTGVEPPPSPVSAKTYTDAGLPWFSVYDESHGYLPPANLLTHVKSVRDRDAELGEPSDPVDGSAEVCEARTKTILPPPRAHAGGKEGSATSTG